MVLLSLVVAVSTMVAYLAIIWWMDRYDREPIGLLLWNFLWGALGAIVLAVIYSVIVQAGVDALFRGVITREIAGAIITAPVVEETMKGLFLFYTALDRRFDNVTDGAVYGAAIGLGFGMTENFFYFLDAGSVDEWIVLVFVRTFFSAVMHGMATATFGAFVGFGKFQPTGTKGALVLTGLFIAITIHFIWNASLSFGSTAVFGILFIMLGLVATVMLFQISLAFESKMIQRELGEEAKNGVIPTKHLEYLPFTSRRNRVGWYPPHVDRGRYVRLATELAFRKDQSRRCASRDREWYVAEIGVIRRKLSALLYPTGLSA
ncbi:MAG: PrsW family intramembrane metalloprotease [Bacteroidota bacterium]